MINPVKEMLLPLIIMLSVFLGACNDQQSPKQEHDSSFAKGADVSWITEMEASGRKFYNAGGVEMEGMRLLKSLGMNSIRLRVWVNPEKNWNNAQDVLAKSIRAKNLGMQVMIDFHYSDTWADPGHQTKPIAWTDYTIDELKTAVASHTTDVLTLLKNNGITPQWVQVGNETGNGMLWDDGRASLSMKNYADLTNAGYDAVKEVFPQTKVIVHIENGEDNGKFRWIFDGLKNNGAKWDVIGMSLYPIADWRQNDDTWQEINTKLYNNMNDMVTRYGSEIMVCEVGLPWDKPNLAYEALTDIITKTKSVIQGKGLGVFYWEPQSYGSWNGYNMGAFDSTGKPTKALNAFK